jgi:hypothetical protein
MQSAFADTDYEFTKMAMSGNGQIIYVTNRNGSIWKSTDTGATWSSLPSAGTRSWATVSTSQDGSIVVAAVATGFIYVSNDSGATWSERSAAGSRSWRTVTVSSDGTKIRAITSNDLKLYQSNDQGDTWSENATLPTTLASGRSAYSWAELTMSGSAQKIALLVTATTPYSDGRMLFISLDSGSTWEQREGCCRDQSTTRQIASSRSDTNWTIMMGNYQSRPGYLRYNTLSSTWSRTELVVRERAGDTSSIYTTTWKGFAIAEDGDQAIFTGSWQGWEPGHAGRNESLFTGSISTELSGVFHDDEGVQYNDVGISDSGTVRAALKSSTGEFIVSRDSGLTFSRVKIFNRPLTPTFGSASYFLDRYTIAITNYDPSFTWSVSSSSGSASIDASGIVTVLDPVDRTVLTVTTNKAGFPQGSQTFNAKSLQSNQTSSAVWAAVPSSVGSNIFNNSILKLAVHPITGDIYAGGLFTDLGGETTTDYIARFNGNSWQGLLSPSGVGLSPGSGSGQSGVFALSFDSRGNLYVGGKFSDAGGNENADFLARWDGTNWSALGASTPNDALRDIEVINDNEILIGGLFTRVGTVDGTRHIARWDGTAWQKIGDTPLTSYLLNIEHSRNGNIYISGHFFPGGGGLGGVAKLVGNDWVWLGSGLTDLYWPIKALSVDDRAETDVLFVGAYGRDASVRSQSLTSWNGSSWSMIDFGFQGIIRDLKFDPHFGLLIAGNFESDNSFATGFGVYVKDTLYGIGDSNNDGTGSAAGNRYSSHEAIISTSDGKIYVGGNFFSIANVSNTGNLARTTSWTPPAILNLGSSDDQSRENDLAQSRAAAAKREAEKRAARAELVDRFSKSETATYELFWRAEMYGVTAENFEAVQAEILLLPDGIRGNLAQILKVVRKHEIVDSIAAGRFTSVHAAYLVDVGLIPQESKFKSSLTFALRKFPLFGLSSFSEIKEAIDAEIAVKQARIDRLAAVKAKISASRVGK